MIERVVHQNLTITYLISVAKKQTATGTEIREKVWDVRVDPNNVWYELQYKEEEVEE